MKKIKNTDISLYILTAYIFLIFCIYPLYVDDGYYNIGITKVWFLFITEFLTFLLLLIAKLIQVMKKKKESSVSFYQYKFSITEKLLYIYMAVVIFSFLLSPFKEYVLFGLEDWGVGTVPLLLMSSLSVFLIHEWKEQKWLGFGCLIVSEIVFIIGICHRFSLYPILLQPTNDIIFISTLGNINWFCGYMSVISPIGVGMYILNKYDEPKNKWKEYLLICYILTSFIIGFCQGSSSYFIWTAVLFVVSFLISLKSIARLEKFALTVSLWGIAGQAVRITHYMFPGRYNYDMSVFNSTIDTDLTLIIAMIGILFYFLIKDKKELTDTYRKIIVSILIGTISIGVLLYIILSIYNTKVGITNLSSSLFLWNDQWGSGRGLIYKESVLLFSKMNFLQKIIGVGADGFYFFAYSFPDTVTTLNNAFNESILTNAHCEILTNLINLGILGTVVYIGILVTFFIRCMKYGEQHPMLYVSGLCTICYFTNNLVSFAHVLNLPFLFILIGLSEHYMRKIR